jgi:cellulose biosynthesis protein BcsQ
MIISFYSYKGGVGRTQLAANLAAYLCYYKQRKVLIIDWDMEAPGVDFFYNIDRSKIKFGLLDLFNEFVKTVRSKENITDKDLPKIFEQKTILENKKSKYIINLIKSKKKEGCVDLIPSGNYNDNFAKKVSSFDWFEFYETLNGKYFIEYLKEELNKSDYDYVLIDSRTGTSDYAGICNIQFPELNVFVIAPTNLNFIGSKDIITSILNSPYVNSSLRMPLIMPILSRLDRTDKISGEWFGKFRETFQENIKYFLQFLFKLDIDNNLISENFINEYIENTLLEYKTEISYGEKLVFFEIQKKIEYLTLEKQFVLIAEYLEKLDNRKETNEYSSDIINSIRNFENRFINLQYRDKKKLISLINEYKFLEVFQYLDSEIANTELNEIIYKSLKNEYIHQSSNFNLGEWSNRFKLFFTSESVKSKIYFSYAWSDTNEESTENLINKLYEDLKSTNYYIIRDSMNLGYRGSITDYMNEVGRNDFIVISLTDKYLRSQFCMYEFYEIIRNSKFDKEIFSKRVVLLIEEFVNLSIHKTVDSYFDFWDKKLKEFENLIKNRVGQLSSSQFELFNQIKLINQNLGLMIDFIIDNSYNQIKLSKDNYNQIKQLIINKYDD